MNFFALKTKKMKQIWPIQKLQEFVNKLKVTSVGRCFVPSIIQIP